ncbi:MAG: endonuclease/exonuclease/phosphatase family protein [Prevotellaceae bacterium]|nr:endonuclease/exonuclease/phosphatase family protein [Prevotellaceae bacterium]
MSYKLYVLLCMALAASFFAEAQSVSCTPDRVAFTTSVAAGQASAAQRVVVTAVNLSSGAVIMQPGSQVQVSLTGADNAYSRIPITMRADELAEGKTIYVRFAPACGGFPDSAVSSPVIFFNQYSELLGSMAVTGIVRQESAEGGGRPFRIATFNVEWLGCPDEGPADKAQQMRNVATAIRAMDADIVALQEVTDNPTKSLDTVLAYLDGAWDGRVVIHNPSSCVQSEAIVFKRSRATLTAEPVLMSNAGSYSAWASGRYPVEFSFDINTGGYTVPITLINLHAKAYSDRTSYERRVEASRGLKALLDSSSYYSAQNLIVLGDFNDDIDVATYRQSVSPYKNFVDDSLNYRFVTTPVTEDFSMIDHILISGRLFPYYIPHSARLEHEAESAVPGFRDNTSDHLPVSASFAFGKVEQEIPVPDIYAFVKPDSALSLDMPVAYSTEGQLLRYAIDSGVVASLTSQRIVTFFDTGVVRMVAWQPGGVAYAPVAKFFYIRVTSRSVAPQITAQPAAQSVALRTAAVFYVQATGTALRYQWKRNGVKISGATSFRHAIRYASSPHVGYYSCEVSNELGSVASQAAPLCVDSSCPALPTAADKNVFERRVRLYPNPVQQTLFVESAAGNIAEVRIYSAGGAMVYEQKNVRAPALSIDTSGWESGAYVAAIVSDRGEKAAKVVVKLRTKN